MSGFAWRPWEPVVHKQQAASVLPGDVRALRGSCIARRGTPSGGALPERPSTSWRTAPAGPTPGNRTACAASIQTLQDHAFLSQPLARLSSQKHRKLDTFVRACQA